MKILAPVRQNFVTAHTHDFNSVLLDVTSYWDKIIQQGQRFLNILKVTEASLSLRKLHRNKHS